VQNKINLLKIKHIKMTFSGIKVAVFVVKVANCKKISETERSNALGGAGRFLEEFSGEGRKYIGASAVERMSSRSLSLFLG